MAVDRSTARRTLGFAAFGVPWFDAELAQSNFEKTRSALTAGPWQLVAPTELLTTPEGWQSAWEAMTAQGLHALVLQVGTFPDGDMIAAVASRADVPVVLCTVNEDLSQTVPLNSTCGGMFAGFIFREHGRTYLQSHVDTAGPHAFADLVDKARTAVALGALAGESIALVGEPPPGFLPSGAPAAAARGATSAAVHRAGGRRLSAGRAPVKSARELSDKKRGLTRPRCGPGSRGNVRRAERGARRGRCQYRRGPRLAGAPPVAAGR